VDLDEGAARARTLELAGAYQKLLAEGRLDEWIELWHPDAVLEFPFAPAGRRRTYHGRAEILDYMRSASGRIAIDSVRQIRAHPGADPQALVVELSTLGHLTATGAAYNQDYVCVFEVQGGLLWRYREYWNPLVSVEAHGGFEAWIAVQDT
jgi:ketosteroid isomerase-like protein